MQLPLFLSKKITLTEFLPEDCKRVEDIALEVAERGTLIYGEPYNGYVDTFHSSKWVYFPEKIMKERRLDWIIFFLSNEPEDGAYYTIRCGQDIIGFVAFWNGWLSGECESSPPAIELAFINPDFKYKQNVIKLLDESLERYAKDCEY